MKDNEITEYEYNASGYKIVFKGTKQDIIDDLDRLCDFYRNEAEAFMVNSYYDMVEELEDNGFDVIKLKNDEEDCN